VESLVEEGDHYKVSVQESVCSCGEDGSRKIDCYYTLGALQGFLNEVTGKNLHGKQTAWVTTGDAADVFEFDPLV
jgi:predicted hydrocarbon binding protein